VSATIRTLVARFGAFAEAASTRKLWIIATTVTIASAAYVGKLGLVLSDSYSAYHKQKVAMENAVAELEPLPYMYDAVKDVSSDCEVVMDAYFDLVEKSESPRHAPPRDAVASEATRLAEARSRVRVALGLIDGVTFTDARLEQARVKWKDALRQVDDVFTGLNNGYTYFQMEVSPIAINARVVNDVLPAQKRAAADLLVATNMVRQANIAAGKKQHVELEHLTNQRRLLLIQAAIGVGAALVVLVYAVAVIAGIRRTPAQTADVATRRHIKKGSSKKR
jgi:hypothetical protein